MSCSPASFGISLVKLAEASSLLGAKARVLVRSSGGGPGLGTRRQREIGFDARPPGSAARMALGSCFVSRKLTSFASGMVAGKSLLK